MKWLIRVFDMKFMIACAVALFTSVTVASAATTTPLYELSFDAELISKKFYLEDYSLYTPSGPHLAFGGDFPESGLDRPNIGETWASTVTLSLYEESGYGTIEADCSAPLPCYGEGGTGLDFEDSLPDWFQLYSVAHVTIFDLTAGTIFFEDDSEFYFSDDTYDRASAYGEQLIWSISNLSVTDLRADPDPTLHSAPLPAGLAGLLTGIAGFAFAARRRIRRAA